MSHPLVVRAVAPDEMVDLSDLAARTFPLACPPHTTQQDIDRHVAERLSPEAFAADLGRDEISVFVAEADGGLVGFTMLVRGFPPPDGPCGERPVELRRIYVDRDRHGSGVGAQLMRSALEQARAWGHDQIWLGTNQLNASAISFYQRHGFRITGAKTFRVGTSVEHDHVLSRGL